uniref:Uncharacterized protein n=1 Tax=Candidatus Kentrum sp. FW TaxID=2126338 RepID=A0A450TPZ0_9GAMM|nr:MAG: hypothetical protein BECKFW1821B_GA0114236_11797 [Candidatus Kentron sp. FW]
MRHQLDLISSYRRFQFINDTIPAEIDDGGVLSVIEPPGNGGGLRLRETTPFHDADLFVVISIGFGKYFLNAARNGMRLF